MTDLARLITDQYFDETQTNRETVADFTSPQTCAFLQSNGFKLEEHIDPRVRRYFGSFLTTEARKLIGTKFTGEYSPLVWINCNENSDFCCPNTFRVEIGIKDERNGGIHTFGMFGSSSVFCATIEAAMLEAAMDFLYKFCEKKGPSIVCWRRRQQ